LFAELKGWMEQTLPRVSGKSDLAGAIRYLLTHFPQPIFACDGVLLMHKRRPA
jgi:hypothetical protein